MPAGAISQYDNSPSQKYGIKNTFHLVAKRLRLEGFLVFQFSKEEQDECRSTLKEWLEQGRLTAQYTLVEGFERCLCLDLCLEDG